MSIEEAYNFRRINEQLTTSGRVTVEQLQSLRRDGYDAVIDLLPHTHPHALPNESRIVEALDLEYVHIPVDFDAPTRVDLELFAEAMDARADEKVHVHCAANYRVSAFCALYLLGRGLCGKTAAREVVHDVWNPSEHPAWQEFLARESAEALP
jgi:protein tyrosine phosphatase (PTP) superfamily phosphohydrolase (DUF442 family)